MAKRELPKFLTLKQAAEALGGNIPASTLRSEIHAGRLRCVRARPGCCAPILIEESAVFDWLEIYASQRQVTLSPTEARKANEASLDES
ncbi:MAG: hypothetical protein BroJett014_27900 [Planctomycetota bacterium]|nr:MAG: hypothetical protein BroJett014_27900 [Planctomycetota bacterium]